jgi:hypothetical protein
MSAVQVRLSPPPNKREGRKSQKLRPFVLAQKPQSATTVPQRAKKASNQAPGKGSIQASLGIGISSFPTHLEPWSLHSSLAIRHLHPRSMGQTLRRHLHANPQFRTLPLDAAPQRGGRRCSS